MPHITRIRIPRDVARPFEFRGVGVAGADVPGCESFVLLQGAEFVGLEGGWDGFSEGFEGGWKGGEQKECGEELGRGRREKRMKEGEGEGGVEDCRDRTYHFEYETLI